MKNVNLIIILCFSVFLYGCIDTAIHLVEYGGRMSKKEQAVYKFCERYQKPENYENYYKCIKEMGY